MELSRQLVHEIEAPLTALELLVRRLVSEHPGSETAASCLREIESLRSLVRDVTALDSDVPEPTRFELRPVLERVVDRFGPIAATKNVSLDVRCPNVAVCASEPATERIVSNLVDNAVKFSSQGGAVVVSATALDTGVSVSVHDDGPGIPDDALGRIFEPFFRMDRERDGSGLGLAISKTLADAQQSELRCTSEPGAGSTFSLSLATP